MMMKSRRGKLFVISGPSGVGKGTLLARVFKAIPDLVYSISCTTRTARPGERDDVDYRFISDDEFQKRIADDEFLEWAQVHGHCYGTLTADVESALDKGKDIILEIDVQGAAQVKKKLPDAVTVFILPPSVEVLEQRLRGRNTESEQSLQLRLRDARMELECRTDFDYLVVNDDLDRAAAELESVIRRLRSVEKDV